MGITYRCVHRDGPRADRHVGSRSAAFYVWTSPDAESDASAIRLDSAEAAACASILASDDDSWRHRLVHVRGLDGSLTVWEFERDPSVDGLAFEAE